MAHRRLKIIKNIFAFDDGFFNRGEKDERIWIYNYSKNRREETQEPLILYETREICRRKL